MFYSHNVTAEAVIRVRTPAAKSLRGGTQKSPYSRKSPLREGLRYFRTPLILPDLHYFGSLVISNIQVTTALVLVPLSLEVVQMLSKPGILIPPTWTGSLSTTLPPIASDVVPMVHSLISHSTGNSDSKFDGILTIDDFNLREAAGC